MAKVNIDIHIDKVDLTNAEELSALDIKYKGGFIGEVFGEAIVRMNTSRIIILFFELPSDGVLMNYKGKLSFTSIKAYKLDKTPLSVRKRYIDDIISRSNVKWNDTTIKYEDFKVTRNYSSSFDPVIAYTFNQKKGYITPKGKTHLEKLNSNERNILNKIRSNYGRE